MQPEADQRDKLVYNANQIATYFATQPSGQVEGVANHINKFWEPRMRRQLFAKLEAGGAGLHELVLEAARRSLINRPLTDAEYDKALGVTLSAQDGANAAAGR